MNAELLQAGFIRMGARARVGESLRDNGPRRQPLTLDIQHDDAGEYFDIRLRGNAAVELDVADLRRRDRHLLLRAKEPAGEHYYLCGHDEQHWFVAAIPEAAGKPANVFAAMEALKPPEVLEAQRRQGLKGKDRRRRKNAAFMRQGEWFFLPVPKLHVDKTQVVYNEPLSRGNGSKPHLCELLFRKGGEMVYVCDDYPQGLSTDAYHAVLRQKPRAKSWNWHTMFRNPEAYAKGKISHPDHKTIELYIWHRVVMNTEGQSQAMSHVVFLD